MTITLSNISFNTSTSDTPSWTTLFDLVYPEGAYYLSNISTSPATLFGNTASQWTQVTGVYLRADKNTTSAGNNSMTLQVKHLPPHKHLMRIGWGDSNGKWDTVNAATGTGSNWGTGLADYLYGIEDYAGHRYYPEDKTYKIGQSFSIMPKYKNCYAWYRNS